MPVTPATHPSAETLQAFGVGKLDDFAAEVVLRHLESCPVCHQKVAALSGDSVLDHLRDAHGGAPSARSVSGVAQSLYATRDPLTPPPAVAGLPPELVNNPQYDVMRELGRGGMGVVYLAKNVLMDRLEVLKVLSRALLDNAGAADRFLREIRSAAKLSHENVVKAYSALQVGELLVFAMEYIQGEDLARVVKQRGPLPVPNACFYAHQAALGLQHAFEHGMIHRDIKPHNLILSHQGKKHFVKVLDFGLAKAALEKEAHTELTGAGMMLGTPDYVAPEQTMDAARVDIRADIYSLGCTLYYLLTGAPPFKGKSLYEVVQAHISREPRPLDQVREGIPAELAAVVAKMMAKAPAERYQKPAEAAQALVPFIKTTVKARPADAARKGAPPRESGRTETLMEGRATIARAMKKTAGPIPLMPTAASTPPAPTPKAGLGKWWLVGAGMAVLLIALASLWAAGVIKVKTKDGTIVLENLPDDAEVLVDKGIVTINRSDGKPIEIGVAPGKKHQLVVKREGVEVFGEEVELDAGGRQKIVVRLERKDQPPPDKLDGKPFAASASKPSPAEGDGYMPLFNGKDLKGWKTHPSQPGNWRVENGVLVGSGPEISYLYTDRDDYKDFRLRVDVRIINQEGNGAGNLCFRSPFGPRRPADKPAYTTGYAVMMRGTGPRNDTGSLYADVDLVSRASEEPLPAGQWRTLEVIAEGNHVVIRVDGKLSADWIDENRRFTTGHIAVGQANRIAEIRKIEIKVLPPDKDLSNKDAAPDCFLPGNIWKGNAEQSVDGTPTQVLPVSLTILSRDGKTFSARVDTTAAAGRHYIREFHGTVDGGVIRWLGKDVKITLVDKDFKVIRVDQGEIPNYEGKASGDLLEGRAKWTDGGKAYSSVAKLQLEKK